MATYDPAMFGFDPGTGISRPKNRVDVFAQMLMANPGAYRQIRELMLRDAAAARPAPVERPPVEDTSSGIGLPYSQFLSPRTAEASPAAPPAPLGPPIPSREERVLDLVADQNREADIATRERRRAEDEPFNPFGGIMAPNGHMSAPPPPGSEAPSLSITPTTLEGIADYAKPANPGSLWGVVDQLRELDRTMSPGGQPRRAEGSEALPEGASEPSPAAGPIAPPPDAVRPQPRPQSRPEGIGAAPATSGVPMPSTATRATGSTGNPKGLAEDAVEAEEKLNRVQEFFQNRFGIEDPDTRQSLALALMKGGAAMMTAPGNFLEGLGAGVQAGVGGYVDELERDREADLQREIMDLKREEAAAARANDALKAEAARVALRKAQIELETTRTPPSVFDNVQSSEGKVIADAQRISAATGVPFEVIMEQLLGVKAAGRAADPLAGLGIE